MALPAIIPVNTHLSISTDLLDNVGKILQRLKQSTTQIELAEYDVQTLLFSKSINDLLVASVYLRDTISNLRGIGPPVSPPPSPALVWSTEMVMHCILFVSCILLNRFVYCQGIKIIACFSICSCCAIAG